MVVGDSPLVKSEGRAQSNKVGRLWFWGVDFFKELGYLPIRSVRDNRRQ